MSFLPGSHRDGQPTAGAQRDGCHLGEACREYEAVRRVRHWLSQRPQAGRHDEEEALPPGEKQQRMLPGSSSSSAWEAAAKLAFHMAGFGGELVAKKERVEARRPSEVRPAAATTQCTSLHFLSHRRCVCVHRRFARKGRQSGSGRMNERRPGQHGWRMPRLANHARTHFKRSLM